LRRIKKVRNNSISELRNVVNYLVEIFEAPKGSVEIRRIIVDKKNRKLKIDYREV